MDNLIKMTSTNIINFNISNSDDLDKMSSEQRWQVYQHLVSCNAGLMYQLTETTKKYNEIVTYNQTLFNQLNDYKKQEKLIEELQKENKELEQKIKDQTSHIEQQNTRIDNLERKLILLEKRDTPITIREIMVALEKQILMEIFGSKRKAKGFHLVQVLKRRKYKSKRNEFFNENPTITKEHLKNIINLKEPDNLSAHHERPTYTRQEWNDIIKDYSDDDDDLKINIEILQFMEKYYKPDNNMNWNIVAPY